MAVNFYQTCIGDLNSCIMGLPAVLNSRVHDLVVYKCDLKSDGLCIKHDTQMVKVQRLTYKQELLAV